MDPEELDLARESADVSIRISGATPETATPTTPAGQPTRRRSIYNFPFLLRHQDAVEIPDDSASPPTLKKGMKTSGTAQSLHPAMAEDSKPKRGSIIRRKHPTRSSIKIKTVPQPPHAAEHTSDVSILVTEASPESPASRPPLHRQQSESTVVQVLVHRESEEYNQDDDEISPTTSDNNTDAPRVTQNRTEVHLELDFSNKNDKHQTSWSECFFENLSTNQEPQLRNN